MKQKLALFTIALIAVVMGMSVATPAMADKGGKSNDKSGDPGNKNKDKENNGNGQENNPDKENNAGGQDKTEICHKEKTRSVSSDALQEHLDHGDTEGPCIVQ